MGARDQLRRALARTLSKQFCLRRLRLAIHSAIRSCSYRPRSFCLSTSMPSCSGTCRTTLRPNVSGFRHRREPLRRFEHAVPCGGSSATLHSTPPSWRRRLANRFPSYLDDHIGYVSPASRITFRSHNPYGLRPVFMAMDDQARPAPASVGCRSGSTGMHTESVAAAAVRFYGPLYF